MSTTRPGAAALGLGTASFLSGYRLGSAGTTVDGRALVEFAVARGVRYIDTAAAYGDSERLLGGMASTLKAARVRVATKLTAAQLNAGEFGDSLQRLRVTAVDTLLLHSAGPSDLDDARVPGVLAALKASGAMASAGASTYGAAAAERALAKPWCDVVQVEHSILNPSVVERANAVRRPGQQVVVRRVLCKGLLTARRAVADLPAGAVQLLDELEALAGSWGLTLPQLAIRFAIDTPGVDVVVVGASNAGELELAQAARDTPPLGRDRMQTLAHFDRSSESWSHPETWTVQAR